MTLIPRGQARGLTWFIPGEDPTLISKQQIFARIVGALGGRAAEEVIFGDAEVTTGASSDLQMVRALAGVWRSSTHRDSGFLSPRQRTCMQSLWGYAGTCQVEPLTLGNGSCGHFYDGAFETLHAHNVPCFGTL